jgi:hypothetical protein
MEVPMQVSEGAVVGAMFPGAIEPFLVGASMGFVDFAVEAPVRPVIASVLTVVVIMGERRRGRRRDGQNCRGQKSFADAHGLTPVKIPETDKIRDCCILGQDTCAELNPSEMRCIRVVHTHGAKPLAAPEMPSSRPSADCACWSSTVA